MDRISDYVAAHRPEGPERPAGGSQYPWRVRATKVALGMTTAEAIDFLRVNGLEDC